MRRQSEMIHKKGRQGCTFSREESTEVHLDNRTLLYSGMTCEEVAFVGECLRILIIRRQSEMIHKKGRQGCREESTEVHLDNRTLLYSGMTCEEVAFVGECLRILIIRRQSEMIHNKGRQGCREE